MNAHARLPWPDLGGRRCLAVGAGDGALASEMRSRGAGDVVALDVSESLTGAAAATRVSTGSHDRRMGAYDIAPEALGTFEVVACDSLLSRLRDPFRALEGIRRVCGDVLVSSEEVDLALSLVYPRRPLARLDRRRPRRRWWVPNAAGHRRMVFAAGFELLATRQPRPGASRVGVLARLRV